MKLFPFTVTEDDVKHGDPNKPFRCALALALTRTAREKMPTRNVVASVYSIDSYLWIEEPERHRERCVTLCNSRAMDRFQLQFDAGNIRTLDEPLHFRPRQRWT